jgi:hypothetical protein
LVEERVKDATKILNLLRPMSGYKPHFEVIGNYRLIDDGIQPEATVIIKANGKEMHEADTGVGPVDTLAKVLKKSLKSIFPTLFLLLRERERVGGEMKWSSLWIARK